MSKVSETDLKRPTASPADTVGIARAPDSPSRDARRKRPPILSFLLRAETARTVLRVISLLIADYIGVSMAIFTALVIKAGLLDHVRTDHATELTRHYVAFVYLVTVLLFARSGLYADRSRRPGLSGIMGALFQVTIVTLVYVLITGNRSEFSSYYVFYASLFFALLFVGLLRWLHLKATGALLGAAGYRRRALLVGSGAHIEAVAGALSQSGSSPVDVIGYITLRPDRERRGGLRSLGWPADLPALLSRQNVHDVIIADADFPQERVVELVDQCHQRGVTVNVAPTTMEVLMERAQFVPGQSVPLFALKPPVFEGLDFLVKRTFDLVGAAVLLVALGPLLVCIAAAVGLTSRGPVLYRSRRQGMGEAPFACLKFRTMRQDAQLLQDELEERNEASGALFKIRDDPRMTAVGRSLRRFSLDELPQLFNVVRGEMSLVGPRPLPERDFERLESWHKKRYLVLPGITGLWQVSGRSELDFDDLVRLDFLYLDRWSVALDLTILLKTVPAVFSRRGAF